ncbi:MAG: hypothetical protein Q8N52_04780, partial [Acidobacteriota bacterium]|nr:hypothetical protein [Acidobacteriota bacterium]
MHNVAECAAEIGRQLARISRSLANGTDAQLAPRGSLEPPFGNSEITDWVRSIELWREHGSI